MKSIQISKSKIDGVDVIKSDGWDGEVIRLSRQVFNENSSNPFLDRAGVYIIYADHYDRLKYGNEMYIGQGDDVRQRLTEHLGVKPYWNKVLIFTSEKMNIAIAFNIEKDFILRAKIANKYSVMNGDNGQEKKLGNDDVAYTQKYMKSALSVLNLAGFGIFTVNIDGVYSCKKHGTDASVTLVEGNIKQLKILKGSKFSRPRNDDNGFNDQSIKSIIHMNQRDIEFQEDFVVEIEEDVMPYIIDKSVYIAKFTNSCGVKLTDALKKV